MTSNRPKILPSCLVAMALAGLSAPALAAPIQDNIEIAPPPVLASENFPCSECHADMEPDRRRRVLEYHTEITLKGHGEKERWCLDCHDGNDRDKLRLLNGKLVDFTESYLLCRQCHASIFATWQPGIHGKRTGNWDGRKLVYPCVACHNPHQPRFPRLKPEPPPVQPEATLDKEMP